MADLDDIGISAAINLLTALAFLIAFAIFRLQPINDRVYFPKWYLKGLRSSPTRPKGAVNKFVNLDIRTYLRFLKWMPEALRMPEPELIEHAGLDSVVYIRIYLLGLKIFVPIMALAFAVLLPVNWTGKMLDTAHDLTFSTIDKFSISNVPPGSNRFWAHLCVAYASTFWTCYMLYSEYKIVTTMRLEFLSSADRRPDQFTVLVRNVPPDPDESVSEHVEHFFCVNHSDHYLLHQVVYNANKLADLVDKKKSLKNWLIYYQNKYEKKPSRKPTIKTGFWGLCGNRVDAIDYYTTEIEKLSEEEAAEREKVISDPDVILPAAFVSFKSRWGAAVCAQTQQSSNPTIWLTEWAPEPSDVYWNNLAIPYVSLNIRRLLMAVALFFLIFFFMVPITFVQSVANIDGIEKVFPFLKKVIERDSVKSFIQGYVPGIILKIFLLLIPMVIMLMSKIEGFTSFSYLERRSASKYHLFILVNVFLGSIIAGTAFQQLHKFLNQSPTEIPRTIGVSIPMKATFFITYVMVDGWASVAAEVLRLVPLILFHIKNTVLVKTEQDRDEAMDPGFLDFPTYEPRIQLYFLLGLVYCVITPILLPFIIVFFAFAYLVFRHQIINVYDRKYESGAAFWPDVHQRIIIGLVISHLLLLGLLSTKDVKTSTPLLVALPVLTIWFHIVCKGRFQSAFTRFPLEEAMKKDTLERATDPTLNIRSYLCDAYLHPVFKGGQIYVRPPSDEEEGLPLVATKRSQRSSKVTSLASSEVSV
ncbi:CSC1-like protein At4g02900 [Silene latifolia]|uniref:CSC1-like protein At4g02900 n=1 Tax=Silene latifolia TaxID=37657 RepID=UPI003D771ED8